MVEKGKKDNIYKLFSVIVHCGRISGAGHYYAYINTKFEQWYRFNDIIVEKATKEMVFDDNFGGLFKSGFVNENL
jgi:ubiquitin C-terminal hydrolase